MGRDFHFARLAAVCAFFAIIAFQNCAGKFYPVTLEDGVMPHDHSSHDHSDHDHGQPSPNGTGTIPGTTDPAPAAVPLQKITRGYFASMPNDMSVRPSGEAMMTRAKDGVTTVYVALFDYKETVGSGTISMHVHNQPCATGGGAHYKIDASLTTTVESNEIWPKIAVVQGSVGIGGAQVKHLAREDARSVVVHAADGKKIACADLVDGLATTYGKFETMDAGRTASLTISGLASLERTSLTASEGSLTVTGLAPNVPYTAHVHVLPCAQGGGAHYKIDTSVTTTVESNELWFRFVSSAQGTGGVKPVFANHRARSDARSVVIHEPVSGGKVACADLEPMTQIVPGPAAAAKGYNMITGRASLWRDLDGSTLVKLSVAGIGANTSYMAHVHNRPCAAPFNLGGEHYKANPTVAETIENNEIWLPLMTDAKGAAAYNLKVTNHMARPDARAIVIHDTDKQKLVCFDLL